MGVFNWFCQSPASGHRTSAATRSKYVPAALLVREFDWQCTCILYVSRPRPSPKHVAWKSSGMESPSADVWLTEGKFHLEGFSVPL
jgi:hypothetical protein